MLTSTYECGTCEDGFDLSPTKTECVFPTTSNKVVFEDEITGEILTANACPEGFIANDMNFCELVGLCESLDGDIDLVSNCFASTSSNI